jgi:hypothetical protein
MHIPRIWTRAEGDVATPDRGVVALLTWGWGDDEAAARREAESRLERLSERVRRGDPFPRGYEYGSRPIREEVLETIGAEAEPRAVLTRNRYGATVMNAARLLFLDVDLPEGAGPGFIGKLFGAKGANVTALERLRAALAAARKGAFRVYRTAAGFRALATEREFDPAGAESQALMKATDTDPWFVRLCSRRRASARASRPSPGEWG